MDVVVYARLSQRGEEQDLERQLRLCRQRATAESWIVVAEFVDNGVSGWRRGVKRHEYERLLAGLDGSAEVLAYNADRLFRQDRERLRFFDAYRAAGLRHVRFVDGMDADLGSADGRKYFRDLGSAAEHQSDRASERIRRKMEELSADGRRWGGRRPFGYAQGTMELVPAEANAIRAGADAILEGRSAYHVAKLWNDAGITATGGSRWSERAVTRVLGSALIAGLREHRRDGQVLGVYDAAWPHIVSREEHETLRSLMATKRPRGVLPRRHPLTGIVRCALCSTPMRGTTIAGGTRVYACMPPDGCGRMSIVANATEDAIFDAVEARDPSFSLKRRLTSPAPGLTRETLLALAQIEEQRRALAIASGLGADVATATQRLDAEEASLRSSVAPAVGVARDPELDDPGRRDRRHRGELTEAEVLQSRDWVASLVDHVDVAPSRSPRAPQIDRLEIVWRDA